MSSLVPRIEEIVLDKGDTGLGFNIRGGVDNTHVENDPGIFVTTVKMNGAAAKDGRLQPGDKILEINGNDLREVQHQKAVSYFHDAGSIVSLLVERGAEHRLLSEYDPLRDQDPNSLLPDGVKQKSTSMSTSSTSWLPRWSWLPISATTLIVGGSAALLLFWYLRRRRQ